MMRFIDHRVELVVAGSSGAYMPTFGEWERTVLGHTADLIDHISLHAYYEENGDVATFLASGEALGRYIDQVAAIIDETTAKVADARHIGISIDEWNVWNITRFNEVDKEPLLTGEWLEHPPVIEDDYTVTDAVVVGSLLLSMLRRVDRVTMAAQAQLVNVIAPIKTTADGPAWRQTTFHPFAQTARLATGDSLSVRIDGDTVDGGSVGPVTALDAAATVDGDSMAVFLVNRALDDDLELTASIPTGWMLAEHPTVLTIPDGGTRLDISTSSAEISPRALDTVSIDGETLTATLPAVSWSVIQLKRETR
jgi:alpha-N-arabinofuranosidase